MLIISCIRKDYSLKMKLLSYTGEEEIKLKDVDSKFRLCIRRFMSIRRDDVDSWVEC